MRHFAILLVLILGLTTAAALPPPEPTAPARPLRIEWLEAVDARDFPMVTVRFRLLDAEGKPPATPPPVDLVIYEDGQEVHRIQPQAVQPGPVAAMLVLDTSGSMSRQNKLAEGQAAARRFFAALDPTTPSGLVLFHHEIYLRLPPRLERRELSEHVAGAVAAGGTAYLDATVAALDLLPAPKPGERRAVVLLTDGRDVNSRPSLAEVVEQARARQAAVYTVGLGEPGRHDYIRTALVLDRSGSMSDGGKMTGLKRAARRFIDLLPSEAADVTLIAFNDEIHFLLEPAQFTSDQQQLTQALDRLKPVGETRLWDAVLQGLRTLDASRASAPRPPRLALVALTDGIDNRSSSRGPEPVIALARRLSIPIYMLGLGRGRELQEEHLREVAARTGGQYHAITDANRLTEVFESLSIDLHDDGIDETGLRWLADQTGGEYFDVRQADRLGQVFERVAVHLESTYAVTFRSRRDRADGTARGIEIRLGDLAQVDSSYKTYGLMTPASEPRLYLGALATVLVLLALPRLWPRSRS
ncbi:MAG TPA: VWA domain-containing protein [Gemmatales bacterium]|nr:VWA domain-containing protein [Gemmatales bacterium]